MNHQFSSKEPVPHLINWQMAYVARELRHNKTVTLSCLKTEADDLLKQLGSFSNTGPIKTKVVNKPNSKEILLEIADLN